MSYLRSNELPSCAFPPASNTCCAIARIHCFACSTFVAQDLELHARRIRSYRQQERQPLLHDLEQVASAKDILGVTVSIFSGMNHFFRLKKLRSR